jgi:hypothetical protein
MVPISPQAYSAEAVVFDTRPLAALQQKLAAKKAAKDEALDKYFLDLKNKINPAGMRTQDLPEWNKELENWISNGVMNRKEIAKGGMAQQEYLLKYQNLLSKVEQSKQMGKFQSDLESKKQEGKIDEDDFPLLDSIRLSIYNPQHYKNTETLTPYSMGDFSENIPTWDVSKRKQFIDYSAAGVDPAGKINEKSVFDPVTQRKTTTFDKVYTEDQLMKMAERAVAIGSDRSGLKTYKKILESGEQVGKRKVINPVTQQEEIVLEPKVPSEEFIKLAKAYNSVFKNDIMDTPLKVAAADIILNKMGVAGRGETSYARPRDTNINLGGDGGKQFVDYYGEIEGKLRMPVTIGKPGAPKEQRIEGYPVNKLSAITQDRIIDIAKKLTGEDYAQGDLLIQRNPKDKLIYLSFVEKDDATGVPIRVTQLVPLTKQDINLEPQVSVKEKREAASEAAFPTPKDIGIKKPKTYSIGGKEFTLSQIQAGAKKNKMTVAEYLSSFGLKE